MGFVLIAIDSRCYLCYTEEDKGEWLYHEELEIFVHKRCLLKAIEINPDEVRYLAACLL